MAERASLERLTRGSPPRATPAEETVVEWTASLARQTGVPMPTSPQQRAAESVKGSETLPFFCASAATLSKTDAAFCLWCCPQEKSDLVTHSLFETEEVLASMRAQVSAARDKMQVR